MLTGDSREAAHAVAQKLGIDRVDGQLLPGDKVEKVEELLAGLENGRESGAKHRGRLVFVGDGINDAPVLARADVGIAMGGLGSDAAIEAADIVIMNDEPSRIPLIMEISRKTMRIVRQNIVFALGIKLLVLALSTVGYANMWMAVFADVGVSVLAIINSFRAMSVKEK
jgi:Cd2+/Zn2+-exporting ATPase